MWTRFNRLRRRRHRIVADVLDDNELLRRVLNREDFLEWHSDLGRWIPSLAGLKFDPDGMSVFVRQMLEEVGRQVAEVSSLGGTKNAELVYGVEAGTARAAGFGVEHSPNEETPIGFAHGSVIRPPQTSKSDFRDMRADVAERMVCLHGTPIGEPPPGA